MDIRSYVLRVPSACSGDAFGFRGANGPVLWPRRNGAALGSVGVANFLNRLRVPFSWVEPERLPPGSTGKTLWAVIDEMPAMDPSDALRQWLDSGGRILASGNWKGWLRLLDVKSGAINPTGFPYAALAASRDDGRVQLIAPPGWGCLNVEEPGKETILGGELLTVRGERQTPSRALLESVPRAPETIQHRGIVYLNANPFAALQSWLQGQEDLIPWLGWRHRLFWLDEYVSDLADLLIGMGFALAPDPDRPLAGTTVVLRHDLDHSRDTAYLDLEDEFKVPGVHAVLRDENRNYWTDILARHTGHECSLHYNTGTTRSASRIWAKLAGRTDPGILPARSAVIGKGLARQIDWARSHGIGVETIHRHLAYLFYPEWIDALDHALHEEPGLLGSGSLFRGSVLRWGLDRVDGAQSTVGDWPDALFPFWFPIRLAHAGDGGRMLNGWEAASIMEPEPELVDAMLQYPIRHLPDRIITFNFHPAHAKRPTLVPGGSQSSFRRTLDLLRDQNVRFKTFSSVLSTLNRYSQQLEQVNG